MKQVAYTSLLVCVYFLLLVAVKGEEEIHCKMPADQNSTYHCYLDANRDRDLGFELNTHQELCTENLPGDTSAVGHCLSIETINCTECSDKQIQCYHNDENTVILKILSNSNIQEPGYADILLLQITYKCVAENTFTAQRKPSTSISVHLTTIGVELTQLIPSNSSQLHKGDTFVLRCTVNMNVSNEFYENIHISFHHADQSYHCHGNEDNNHHHTLSRTSNTTCMMNISKVNLNDSGQYRCKAFIPAINKVYESKVMSLPGELTSTIKPEIIGSIVAGGTVLLAIYTLTTVIIAVGVTRKCVGRVRRELIENGDANENAHLNPRPVQGGQNYGAVDEEVQLPDEPDPFAPDRHRDIARRNNEPEPQFDCDERLRVSSPDCTHDSSSDSNPNSGEDLSIPTNKDYESAV